jgi:hypothetical protein
MQFGGGGISFVPNQTPPAAPVVFPVTAANNALRLNGTTVQLGGPLAVPAPFVEQDSIATIQAAIPGQRFAILYDFDNANQFLILENLGHWIMNLASQDGGLGLGTSVTIDPNTVLIAGLAGANFVTFGPTANGNNFTMNAPNGMQIIGDTVLAHTGTAWGNGAAAAAGTLNNAPAAGNPTKWIPVDDNGTTRFIPAW